MNEIITILVSILLIIWWAIFGRDDKRLFVKCIAAAIGGWLLGVIFVAYLRLIA